MSVHVYEKLRVCRFPDRKEMARAAADHVRGIISAARTARGVARIIVACSPSQNDFFSALVAPPPTLPWADVIVYHMDEYVGLSGSQQQSSRHYLQSHLLSAIPAPRAFHGIRGEAPSLDGECRRYTQLLRERPIDLVCLGIGERGSIAFNDPTSADFDDRKMIKVATLDDTSRQEQVDNGCFARLKDVPTQAFTLTVSALGSARAVCGVVPGARKARAVRDALLGPIDEACPASILRTHPAAVLHLDDESASLLR